MIPLPTAALLMETSLRLAERGEYKHAARLLEQLSNAGVVTPASLMLLALCAAELGNGTEADQLFALANGWIGSLDPVEAQPFFTMRDHVLKVLNLARERSSARQVAERRGNLPY